MADVSRKLCDQPADAKPFVGDRVPFRKKRAPDFQGGKRFLVYAPKRRKAVCHRAVADVCLQKRFGTQRIGKCLCKKFQAGGDLPVICGGGFFASCPLDAFAGSIVCFVFF